MNTIPAQQTPVPCTAPQREACPLRGRCRQCPACRAKDLEPHWGEGMASILRRLP